MIRDNKSRSELDPAFNEIKEALNLKKNKQGIYEFQGRNIGDHPICVPRKTLLAEKNGWEGTLPDVTRGSEFNNDNDSKKVLDTEAETMDARDSAQLHI